MDKARKTIFALAVAFLMVATVIPVQSSEPSDGYRPFDVGTVSEEDKVARYIDYGDNTYSLSLPFLEDSFGMRPFHPEMTDPAHECLGQVSHEIHAYRGDNSMNKVVDPDGTVLSDFNTITYGLARGVEFSAAFSDRALETGVDDVFTYGINVLDEWLIQYTATSEVFFKHKEDSEYLSHLLTEYRNVTIMQSSNILPYAVGNFTEDETEEFALYLGDCVEFYDYVDGAMKMIKSVPLNKQDMSEYDDLLVRPVSMTAGDFNGDGLDEVALLVERSHRNVAYGDTVAEYLMEMRWTAVYFVDINKSLAYDYDFHVDLGGDHYRSVMSSVAACDYDHDGRDEVIIGGYLWETENHSHTADPSYNIGELFIAAFERNDFGGYTPSRAATKLMDDDGTATNGNCTDGRDYTDHNQHDTSILMKDGADNYYGYCQSPNWTNWTVPLKVLDFKGHFENPYVFFNNSIYEISDSGKAICRYHVPLDLYQDNNNCQLVNLDAGAVVPRHGLECVKFDDLYRFVAMDRQDGHGSNVYWSHHVTCHDESNDSAYTTEIPGQTIECDWSRAAEPPMGCLMEWDVSDRVDVKLMSVVSSFLDPVVYAQISGIPYDSDLADCLIAGSENIGETEFRRSSSTSTSEGTVVTVSITGQGNLKFPMLALQGEAGYEYVSEKTKTQTVSITEIYRSSEDAVALYIVPFEVYNYEYTTYPGGVRDSVIEPVYKWLTPMNLMLPYDNYCALMHQYNDSMAILAEKEGSPYEPLEILDRMDHTPGDIASYNTTPAGVFRSNDSASYTGNGSNAYSGIDIELSECDDVREMWGGHTQIGYRIGPKYVNGGLDISADASHIETSSDMRGIAFSNVLAKGLEQHYCWESEDAGYVTAQYGMSGTMWAAKDSINGSPFLKLGYTAKDYTSACKNGWVAPDSLILDDPSDLNDPRNPGADYLYMEVFVPGDVRSHLMGDRYVLQMCYSGTWYDYGVMSSRGIVFQLEGPDGTLTDMRDFDVTPGTDQKYWVKVSGLGGRNTDSFDFRLMGYNSEGDKHPSIRTTGNIDTDAPVVLLEDFVTIGNRLVLPDLGSLDAGTRLMMHTDLPAGTMMHIDLGAAGGSLVLPERCTVGHDGVVVLKVAATEDDDGGVPVSVTVLVFAGILAALGYGAHVIRKP